MIGKDRLEEVFLGIKTSFQKLDKTRDRPKLFKEIKAVILNSMSKHNSIQLTDDVLEHYGADIWSYPSLILNKFKDNENNQTTINSLRNKTALHKKHTETFKNKRIAFAFHKLNIFKF